MIFTAATKKHAAQALRRVGCVFCMIALLLALLPASVQAETPAEKYKRLKEELENTRNQIDSLASTKEQAQQQKQLLEAEKVIIDELVELNRQEIERTEEDLNVKETEIANKRQTIYDNERLLEDRLVAIYEMNTSNMLAQLMQVDNPTDFYQMSDSMRRIAKHDDDLLTLLNTQREDLENEQAEITALLADLQLRYEEQAAHQASLAQNIAQANATISSAEAQLLAQREIEGDMQAQLAQAQKEMAAIAGSIGGSKPGDGSEYVGGVFTWPVPGFYKITCQYGSPDPNGRGHRGMDIGGSPSNGADIVACGNGTVIVAAYSAPSYGNYIVIDHGDGVKTLYAHCSALYASVGTYVEKGTPIAAVGSTGFSTGPHLHLEVQVGGQLQNPGSWLKG